MTAKKMPECFDCIDRDALKDYDLHGARVREIVAGKVDMIPKATEHIKVNAERCNGCQLCVKLCPAGCYEMDGRKAVWRYGQYCVECGACQYFCSVVNAIDWSYPEGGTGMVMHCS